VLKRNRALVAVEKTIFVAAVIAAAAAAVECDAVVEVGAGAVASVAAEQASNQKAARVEFGTLPPADSVAAAAAAVRGAAAVVAAAALAAVAAVAEAELGRGASCLAEP